jgi:peptidoglycan/LPS O-acetylase OafA/YrhL
MHGDKPLSGSQMNAYVPEIASVQRLDAIEWARVLAACGVVWFHLPLGPWKEFGHAGLVAFILISVVFQARGAEKERLSCYIRKKADRVIPAWMAWFGFYALINLAKGKAVFPYSSGIVADLFTGPWIGLWFLPFYMACSVMVFGFSQLLIRSNPWVQSVVFLGIGLCLLMQVPGFQAYLAPQTPWAQWLHAFPAVPIGLGIHGILKLPHNSRFIAFWVFLLVMSGLMSVFAMHHWNLSINYGLAIWLVVLAYLLNVRLWVGITRLGSLCLGVYLIHPVFMSFMKKIPVLGSSALAILAGTLTCSFVMVAVMKKWPATAKIC